MLILTFKETVPVNYTGAVTWPDQSQEWYQDGFLHREDGPAIILNCGTKEWYFQGQLHREDGPAVEIWNGIKEWYYKGNKIRNVEEYKRFTAQLKVFDELAVKIIEEYGSAYWFRGVDLCYSHNHNRYFFVVHCQGRIHRFSLNFPREDMPVFTSDT